MSESTVGNDAGALLEGKESLVTAVAGAPLALFIISPTGVVSLAQGALLAELHLESVEVVGRNLAEVFVGFPQVRATVNRALHGAVVSEKILVADKVFQARSRPLIEEPGLLPGAVLMLTDITEWTRAETELLDSEERSRRLTDAALEGVMLYERDTMLDANQTLATLIGCSLDELLAKPPFHFLAGEFRDEIIQSIDRESERAFEAVGIRIDGTRFPVEVIGRTIPYQGRMVKASAVRDISERKRAEQALKEGEARYRDLFENATDLIFTFDLEGRMTSINRSVEKLLEYSSEEALASNLLSFVVPDQVERAREQLLRRLKGENLPGYEIDVLTKSGRRVTLEINTRFFYRAGAAAGVQGIARDVSARKRFEEELQYRLRFEDLLTGISTHFINRAPEELDSAIHQALRQIGGLAEVDRGFIYQFDGNSFRKTHEWCAEGVEPHSPLGAVIAEGSLLGFEERLRKREHVVFLRSTGFEPSGSADPAWFGEHDALTRLVAPMVSGGTLTGFLGFDAVKAPKAWDENSIALIKIVGEVFVNALERKKAEERLRHAALHDALTGLPNRSRFLEQLRLVIEQSTEHPESRSAVLFLDLDRFKVVNDSLGHAFGDRLLIEIVRRLEAKLEPGCIARLGGDEFTILVEEASHGVDPITVARTVLSELERPLEVDGHEVFMSASIGIAFVGNGAMGADELLRDADTAMYRAKAKGRSNFEVFVSPMHSHAREQLNLENEMRRALIREDFEVFYQPIITLTTGRIAGFEALVRWNHPQRGLMFPAGFIPLAEETGQIIAIGEWVLREACRRTRIWQLKYGGDTGLDIAVNLSTRQFRQPRLAETIQRILDETGLSPDRLKLEITESLLMDDPEKAMGIVGQLRMKNIQFHIDDFGTGYSSLSYLHRFPIDTIKIDKSFIGRIGFGEETEIVRTIATLAHHLKKDVIAEGVETQDQLDELRKLGCKYAQGNFFAPAQGAAGIEALLEANRTW